MPFILDASSTVSWCVLDEQTPASLLLLRRARTQELIYVPSHWLLEVMTALLRAGRRGRIDEEGIADFIEMLLSLRIKVLPPLALEQIGDLMTLARKYQLSAYDSSYLLLGRQLGLEVATRDRAMVRACVGEGIPLVGLVDGMWARAKRGRI